MTETREQYVAPQEHTRDCHRLCVVVRQSGSAERLTMDELLRLSDWLCGACYADVAPPVMQELGRRLRGAIEGAEHGHLIDEVREMRRRQCEYWRNRTKGKQIARPLLKASIEQERKVDRLLEHVRQPTLFE